MSRVNQRVLIWFEHVERVHKYRLSRWVLTTKVSGGWERGRPRLDWKDGVKVALGSRGVTVEAARLCARDGTSGEP